MTDRVHATMNDVKPSRFDPALDDAPSKAGFEELPASDDSVLPGGKFSDHPIRATVT
jgi:hypothetical protein